MHSLPPLINWLFFDSVFGIFFIAGIVYFILKNSKTQKTNDSNKSFPLIVAGTIVWIAMFTLPSIPRYYFEEKIMSQLNGNNGVKIVEKSKASKLGEPLTWFNAPVESITAVMPGDVLNPGFQQIVFRFNTAPTITFVDADCQDREASFSTPDETGILRVITNTPVKMSEKEILWFCKMDWGKERKAVNLK